MKIALAAACMAAFLLPGAARAEPDDAIKAIVFIAGATHACPQGTLTLEVTVATITRFMQLKGIEKASDAADILDLVGAKVAKDIRAQGGQVAIDALCLGAISLTKR